MLIPVEEMLDELSAEIKEVCAKEKEPSYAYVALEKPKHYVEMAGNRAKTAQLKYQIRYIRLDGHPDQLWKIKQNLENDGQKLITWGKFPQVNDGNKRNQQLLLLHRDNYGFTPWDYIDNYLKNFIKRNTGNQAQLKRMEDEVEQLRAELEQEKIANAKKLQGAK